MLKVNSVIELTQKGDKLPNGIRAKIAQDFNVSPQYVSNVKNGTRNNLKILEAIVKELEFYQKKTAKLRSRINQA